MQIILVHLQFWLQYSRLVLLVCFLHLLTIWLILVIHRWKFCSIWKRTLISDLVLLSIRVTILVLRATGRRKKIKFCPQLSTEMVSKTGKRSLKNCQGAPMCNVYTDGKKYLTQTWLKDPGLNKRIEPFSDWSRSWVLRNGLKSPTNWPVVSVNSAVRDGTTISILKSRRYHGVLKSSGSCSFHTGAKETNGLKLPWS